MLDKNFLIFNLDIFLYVYFIYNVKTTKYVLLLTPYINFLAVVVNFQMYLETMFVKVISNIQKLLKNKHVN